MTGERSTRERVAEVIWRWDHPLANEGAFALVLQAHQETDRFLLANYFDKADAVLAALHIDGTDTNTERR